MPAETVKKVLPWRAGVPAWIMAAEGAIIAFLGFYILNNQESAIRVLLMALGVLMLFNGVPRLSRYYHGPADERAEADMLQGWYGAVVGGGAIFLTLLTRDNPEMLLWVIVLVGIALVIGGLLELFDRFTRNKGNRKLVMFIMPIILIIAGLALVTLRFSNTLTPELLGQLMALLGIALLALGLIRVWGNRVKRKELADAVKQRDQADQKIAAAQPPATPAPAAPAPAAPVAPVAPAAPAAPGEPEDPAVAASRDVTG